MLFSQKRWWIWPSMLATALLVVSCGGDDDGGGNGAVTPQAPAAPEQFVFEEELLLDLDVPVEVSGAAAMVSGMMQMGQAYMGAATGGGTPAGAGCWEWSWVDGQTLDALLITACEDAGGAASWTVTISEAGSLPCTVMRGDVAADGLSGSWSFRDCECDSMVLLSEWATNAAATAWTVDLTIYPVDCQKLLGIYAENDPLYLHYEATSDGSGSMSASQGTETLWTCDWQVSGDEITGTYCWYEGGVQVDCDEFGGTGAEAPDLPTQYEIDDALVDTFNENLPPEASGIISSLEGFQGMGDAWLGLASGEGEEGDLGCWVWSITEGGITTELEVCEIGDDLYAEVRQQCEVGGPLLRQLEMWENADGSGGMTIYDCSLAEMVAVEWGPQDGGWSFTMTMPDGVFDYLEYADGSGNCSWTLMSTLYWDCVWDASYSGTYCAYPAGEPADCFDF